MVEVVVDWALCLFVREEQNRSCFRTDKGLVQTKEIIQ